MNCSLCGRKITSFVYTKFVYMDRKGTIIVEKDKPNTYAPRVKLIYYDGKMERLPVHWSCRQTMRMSEYVRKEYGSYI